MTKALSVAVLLAVGLLAVVLAADIEDCAGSADLGEFTKIEVSDCKEEDSKCPLHRGHNVTITINFKAKKEATAVRQVVHGVMAGMAVPFPLDNPDACQNTGLQCPLTVGDHEYHYMLYVKTVYPKVSVKVKWELQNEKKEQIICALIPAILK